MENLKILDETINFFKICKDKGVIDSESVISNLLKLKKELEEYEQNFKQKEFEYRTACQNLVSVGRVEAYNMPDRLAELEKIVMDYYLAQGYEFVSGDWGFEINIVSRYKGKNITIMVYDFRNGKKDVEHIGLIWEQSTTTKEMWDKAIAHFTTRQNIVNDKES